MAKEIKGENVADVFLIASQILFFMAIFLNYSTNIIPKITFILIALFLLIVSIITFIIKMILKSRK